MARHDAARKEMLCNPIGFVALLEAVGCAAMREHMNEELAVGLKPPADARQKFAPVGHVFEHFDRNDAIVDLPGFKGVHVGGDDTKVLKADVGRGMFDVKPLRGGIRHGRDARRWEALGYEQTERTPAASEFQNLLPIFESAAQRLLKKREFLGFGKRLFAGLVEAARVFSRRPEREREEVRGQFIMLPVRLPNVQRHWENPIHFAGRNSTSLVPGRRERERFARSTSAGHSKLGKGVRERRCVLQIASPGGDKAHGRPGCNFEV